MVLCFLALLSLAYSNTLQNVLRSYETVHKDSISIKYYPGHVILSLQIGGESYVATLSPNTYIFHKHFSVDIVREAKTSTLPSPTEGHYTGALDGLPASLVSVHIAEGIVTGSIHLEGELYYIEPSWRHVPEPHPYHMLLYKRSDVIYKLGDPETGQFCGHRSSFEVPANQSAEHGAPLEYNSSRFKRANSERSTCEVVLVADYKFFTEVGGGSELATKSYMIAIFERITRIFESTQFSTSDRSFSGYGMQVKKVVVHTDPSDRADNYNYAGKNWGVSDLLDAFGYGNLPSHEWSGYCLAHLYTNRDFAAGVLGLAYVASPIR